MFKVVAQSSIVTGDLLSSFLGEEKGCGSMWRFNLVYPMLPLDCFHLLC